MYRQPMRSRFCGLGHELRLRLRDPSAVKDDILAPASAQGASGAQSEPRRSRSEVTATAVANDIAARARKAATPGRPKPGS